MVAEGDSTPADPRSAIRTRRYRVLLVLAALVGLLVSAASWGFLELVHEMQVGIYNDLPDDLGYAAAPWWWPFPWLALAGLLTAFAIQRLPGRGGHVPSDGLSTGGAPTEPIDLPGILLAAVATLGLGLVLGPEAPLIALGAGLGIFAIRRVRKDSPKQAQALMAAAGSFAAVSAIFGSPVIGAVIIIEAAGIGGAMLPVVLLPGLLSAGIGSLVFIGLGNWSGLSTTAWTLSPFPLPAFGGLGWGNFGWTIVLAVAVAVGIALVVEGARWTARIVHSRPFLLTIGAGLAVGGLALAFSQATGEPTDAVLFSGQDELGSVFTSAATVSLSTLALLLVFKGLAWSISLGNFRGGPTFPALLVGVVAGLLAGHLPGYSETPAVAALTGAACVSILKLPLSSVLIATLLSHSAGFAVTPLIIVAVVVAYLTSQALAARAEARLPAATTEHVEEPAPASPAATAPT